MKARASAFLLVACLLSTSCSNNSDPEDFGAQMVADSIRVAERKCAAARANGLYECKSSPVRDARLSAKIADDIQESYFMGCGEVIGLSKCEDLLRDAYEKSRP